MPEEISLAVELGQYSLPTNIIIESDEYRMKRTKKAQLAKLL